MRKMLQYDIWITIEIKHEFYMNDNIPLVLSPDQQTRLLFAKYNIIFRRQMKNQWIILKPEDENLLSNKEDIVFRFDLQVTSDEFYYSTQEYEGKNDEIYRLVNALKPGIWQIMELPYRETVGEDSKHIVLTLQSKQKYFEYLFIPRYTSVENIRLKLAEEKNRFGFKGPEDQLLFDDTKAIRFVTTEQISLRKNYDYKIRLWEIRDSGEKLLSEFIPYPDPGNISVIEPQDAITTYYYF